MDLSLLSIPPSFLDIVPDPAFLVDDSHRVLYRNLVARTSWNVPESGISAWSRLGQLRHRVQWDGTTGRVDGLLTWTSLDGFRLGVLRPQGTNALASSAALSSASTGAIARAASLPVREPVQQPSTGSISSAAPRSVPAPTILAADDNRINRTVIAKLLSRWNMLHTIVDDGTSALQIMERDRFGLILLDWQMPGLDGLEVARRWRVFETKNRRARTPLIAVTSFTFEIERLAFLEAGIDDILPKPVRSDRLAAIIEKWTGYAPPQD